MHHVCHKPFEAYDNEHTSHLDTRDFSLAPVIVGDSSLTKAPLPLHVLGHHKSSTYEIVQLQKCKIQKCLKLHEKNIFFLYPSPNSKVNFHYLSLKLMSC